MTFDIRKIIPVGVLASDKSGDLAKFLSVLSIYYDRLKLDTDGILDFLNIDSCPPDLLKYLAAFLRAELFHLNLIQNPGFDIDSNNDGLPDSWSAFGAPAATGQLINRRHSKALSMSAVNDSCGFRQQLTGLDMSRPLLISAKIRVNTPGATALFGALGTAGSMGITYSANLQDWKTYALVFTPTATSHYFGVQQNGATAINFDVDDFFVEYLDEIDKMRQWLRNCISVYKEKGTQTALISVIEKLTSWTPAITQSFLSTFFQVANWEGSNELNQLPMFDVAITNIDMDRRTLTVDALWGDDPTGQSNVGLCLVPNPSFEEVTSYPFPDYWVEVGAPTIEIVKGYKGANAVKITPSASSEGLQSATVTLLGGDSYNFTATVKAISGNAPTIKVRNVTDSTDDIVLDLTQHTDEFLVYNGTGVIHGAGVKNCVVQLLGNLGDVFSVDETLIKPDSLYSFNYWCWLEPTTPSSINKRHKNHVENIYVSSSFGSSQIILGEDVGGNWTTGRIKGMPWEMQSIQSEIDAGAYFYFTIGDSRKVIIKLGAPTDNVRKEMLTQILTNYLPVGVSLEITY